MTSAPDRLLQLMAVAEAARVAAPADTAAWFDAGVTAYLSGENDLEGCLGLRPEPGGHKPVTQRQYRRRNDHLRRAWQLLDGSRWRRSVTLSEAVARFELRRWPRWRHFDEPPVTAASIDAVLFYAARCGCGLPSTPERLHAIVTEGT